MKKKNILNLICGAACLLGLATSCSVDPEFYSQVVPDTFYSSQNAVWQRFSRPFTHWRWWVGHNDTRFALQELGTDVIRNKLNKADMLIERQLDDIEIYSYFYDAIIVPDIRLPKEIDSVKAKFDNVVAIHINRINFESDLSSNQQSHITETAMDNYTNFDYEVTNDTLEQLEKDIYKIYKEETK